MQTSNVYEWIKKEENRKKILTTLRMPLTTKQLAKKAGIPRDTCSYVVLKMTAIGILTCLNHKAGNSRIYWLTDKGNSFRKKLCQDLDIPFKEYGDIRSVNWVLYGWVCYNHRSVVLRALTESMQPSEIKRRIRLRFSSAKISANNVRDVIRLFERQGIFRKVFVRKKAHPRYELTELGNKLRQILLSSEVHYSKG